MLQNEDKLKEITEEINNIPLDDHDRYNRERRRAKEALNQFRSQAAQELVALIKKQKIEMSEQIEESK